MITDYPIKRDVRKVYRYTRTLTLLLFLHIIIYIIVLNVYVTLCIPVAPREWPLYDDIMKAITDFQHQDL